MPAVRADDHFAFLQKAWDYNGVSFGLGARKGKLVADRGGGVGDGKSFPWGAAVWLGLVGLYVLSRALGWWG